MHILQIDASSTLCSVAMAQDGRLLHMEINDEPLQHGRDINILTDELLSKCGCSMQDIDAVSVNSGPGSYTALRIGMATAKGLCYGLDIPLLAPSGLDILVDYAMKKYPGAAYYIPMIDARRMEVYTTDPVRNLDQPMNYKAKILNEMSYSALIEQKVCFIGSGVKKWKDLWPEHNQWIGADVEVDAGMMSRISDQLLKSDNISNLFATTPIYIKKPNITTSKKVYFN
ncbi:tRNA (adenosine(37)-N6)-threonylcarbamoyltransferase complex dimerization subunit type 1 TsaB [Membranicola marinus]|uniref:tRNA (Adenosine(37)-N6)-threonylcarbamoyltransferase complex dimerization subunit type 1 TsaB n=1 Tax=Membranihabitans marinus TaxID=1227546 RepID=A0A953HWQ0_9BACT|nr:tRNA (adenosine(37)-N6)-threonylcarbamoyltransferase complex dimerization subunit type 1 TsaB [Membranihabitans marinus]MBY5959635.1 tRNA (adenosine(37)-N6)-threonylcarbamoyltransferase complex dimerization subunit type 1 TsaB [Membranihabitans marinus]